MACLESIFARNYLSMPTRGCATEKRAQFAVPLPQTAYPRRKGHHLILGNTTKHNRGRKKATRWVTSVEGVRSRDCTTDRGPGLSCTSGHPARSPSRRDNYPLFVSLTYLGFTGSSLIIGRKKFLPAALHLRNSRDLLMILAPKIQDSDIDELERIDPFRAWRAEKAVSVR